MSHDRGQLVPMLEDWRHLGTREYQDFARIMERAVSFFGLARLDLDQKKLLLDGLMNGIQDLVEDENNREPKLEKVEDIAPVRPPWKSANTDESKSVNNSQAKAAPSRPSLKRQAETPQWPSLKGRPDDYPMASLPTKIKTENHDDSRALASTEEVKIQSPNAVSKELAMLAASGHLPTRLAWQTETLIEKSDPRVVLDKLKERPSEKELHELLEKCLRDSPPKPGSTPSDLNKTRKSVESTIGEPLGDALVDALDTLPCPTAVALLEEMARKSWTEKNPQAWLHIRITTWLGFKGGHGQRQSNESSQAKKPRTQYMERASYQPTSSNIGHDKVVPSKPALPLHLDVDPNDL